MPEKDPNTWTALSETIALVLLAVFGGMVKFWRTKILNEEMIELKSIRLWLEFFVEMWTAAFVGLVCFYACKAAGVDETWTICIVAIAGHEGARIIPALYKFIEKRVIK